MLVLLALSLLPAGAAQTARAAGVPSCARPLALDGGDLRRAGEYFHVVGGLGRAIWQGWTPAPLLQRTAACEYLIGHPAPPPLFRRVPGLRVAGRIVFAAPAGTASPAPAATAWKVNRVWTAVSPVRVLLQRLVDRQLGRGAVRLDDASYVRVLAHESFHAYQLRGLQALPTFGNTFDEGRAVALLGGRDAAERRLATEGAVVRDAVVASTIGGTRAAVVRFLDLRRARHSAVGDAAGLRTFEQQLEWTEGLARYADLRLFARAGQPGYRPTSGIAYPGSAATFHGFLGGLASRERRADGLRGRWEDLGAAEALLLDRLVSGWRGTALRRPKPLDELLAASVGSVGSG